MPHQIGQEGNETTNQLNTADKKIKAAILLILFFLAFVLSTVIMILVFGCDKGLQGTRCDECVEGYYKHFSTCIEGSCNPNGTLHQDAFGACLCDAGYSGPQCLKN